MVLGWSTVNVRHISGDVNPADLYTKILSRQVFEKHRKVVMNLPGDTGAEHAHRRHSAEGRRNGGMSGEP